MARRNGSWFWRLLPPLFDLPSANFGIYAHTVLRYILVVKKRLINQYANYERYNYIKLHYIIWCYIFYITFICVKQKAEKNSTMGRVNSLFYSAGKPNNVTWGINNFLQGHHGIAGPRSALVQILHSHFSHVSVCLHICILKENNQIAVEQHQLK